MLMYILISAAIVIAALGTAWLCGVRFACLRRSDCCGRGCGCILPRKPKQRPAVRKAD